MKRFTGACVIAALAVVAACADSVSPGPPGKPSASVGAGPHVTGSGHLERDLGAGPELTSFSYNAIAKGDTASGQFQFNFRAADLKVHGYVSCVTVVDNVAWIGGVITRLTSTDPADQELVGTDVWWRVRDNGEGDGAAPDRTTSLLFTIIGVPITAASWCANREFRGLERDIQEGNIQVRN